MTQRTPPRKQAEIISRNPRCRPIGSAQDESSKTNRLTSLPDTMWSGNASAWMRFVARPSFAIIFFDPSWIIATFRRSTPNHVGV
ncbi:hypothetical protein EYR38_002730 [Pleurotus pulmonarius]|nr:hypothetical protein EYR38_002730 [Pleurotus pulmonarius]